MVKILYALNGIFNKGGTEAVVLSYYNHIDREKYHIDFLLHGYEKDNIDNSVHNYLLSCGSKILYVMPRGKNYIKNKRDIAEVFKNEQYDIVHSHMDAAGYFVLKEAKRAGVQICISHSHNTAGKIPVKNPLKRMGYSIILEIARKNISQVTDLRIACSTEAGEWLFGNSDFILINNAIDIKKYSYDEKIRLAVRKNLGLEKNIVLGHVGRFAPQKNHTMLIDIFARYVERHHNAKMILVGEGQLKSEISNKVRKLGLQKEVIFLGERSDVNELMQAFDIFLLPSIHEGLPVVGVEAQTAGVPCIISSAVSSEVKLSDNVELVSLDEPPDTWCDAIDRLYLANYNRAEGDKIVQKAGFDIDDVIIRLEEVYDNALAED